MNRLQEAEEVLEQQVRRGNLIHVPSVCQLLGRACVVLGRIEDAQRVARQAMEGLRARPEILPRVLLALADIARPSRSLRSRGERETVSRSHGGRRATGPGPIIAHCHLGLGGLYSRLSRRQEAGEHLTIARQMYREMDMTFWLKQVEQEA